MVLNQHPFQLGSRGQREFEWRNYVSMRQADYSFVKAGAARAVIIPQYAGNKLPVI